MGSPSQKERDNVRSARGSINPVLWRFTFFLSRYVNNGIYMVCIAPHEMDSGPGRHPGSIVSIVSTVSTMSTMSTTSSQQWWLDMYCHGTKLVLTKLPNAQVRKLLLMDDASDLSLGGRGARHPGDHSQ